MRLKRPFVMIVVLLVTNILFIMVNHFVLTKDFREAILEDKLRIRINGGEIGLHQLLIWSNHTYVIGVHHNEGWKESVMHLNRGFERIKGTPYSFNIRPSLRVRKGWLPHCVHYFTILLWSAIAFIFITTIWYKYRGKLTLKALLEFWNT